MKKIFLIMAILLLAGCTTTKKETNSLFQFKYEKNPILSINGEIDDGINIVGEIKNGLVSFADNNCKTGDYIFIISENALNYDARINIDCDNNSIKFGEYDSKILGILSVLYNYDDNGIYIGKNFKEGEIKTQRINDGSGEYGVDQLHKAIVVDGAFILEGEYGWGELRSISNHNCHEGSVDRTGRDVVGANHAGTHLTKKETAFRKVPFKKSCNVIELIPAGEEFKVFEGKTLGAASSDGLFLELEYNNKTGWILYDDLEKL
ncbi:hypothetical protein KKA33_03070 [Patescibacteria group bacterium]|nr:hypothetical protein [Patescibacteria group bacterium]